MAQPNQGFSYVQESGFVSLLHDIQSAAGWNSVITSEYDNPLKTPSSPLHKQPFEVQAKVLILRAIQGLQEVQELRAVEDLDKNWDQSQLQFISMVESFKADADPAKQKAANSILNTPGVSEGRGRAQTKLKKQLEVDFARKQLGILQGARAADIATLGLGHLVERIENTTKALATGLGRGEDQAAPEKSLNLTEQIDRAMVECSQCCQFTLSGLNKHLAQPGLTQDDRNFLETLRAPLLALIARYPGKKSTPAEPPTTNPPAPPKP